MTPLRLIGKVSLGDEITMLENLRDKLLSVRGQARLIADSTGDELTQRMLGGVDVGDMLQIVEFLVGRARLAQREQGEETGRVSLQEDPGRS